jgi:photosystem II stability/assembly factor-like uncharacterized protein
MTQRRMLLIVILAALLLGIAPGLCAGAALANSSGGWNVYPLSGGDMTAIAMAPNDAATLYAGTDVAGVFKSVDGGVTWQPARTGLPFSPIKSLGVDPAHPLVLLAGTEGTGLWRSIDGAGAWSAASTGLEANATVRAIVFNPANINIVYVVTGDLYYRGHIYKSTDGGLHWNVSDQGIPRNQYDAQYAAGITGLAVDPAMPQVLYASTNEVGVYQTADGGLNWTAMNGGIPQSGGKLASVAGIAVDPLHANRPTATIDRNFCIYSGTTWTKVNTSYGYFEGPPDHIYFHPTNPNMLYVAGRIVSQSSDGGLTWSQFHLPGGDISDMAFHPSAPDTLYVAGSVGNSGDGRSPGGVYRSADAGVTWTPARAGISAGNLGAIAVDPRVPDRIYAGSRDWANSGVWRSQDRGLTWEFVTYFSEEVNAIAVDPLDSQKIYVADTMGLLESTDGGASYTEFPEVTNGARSLAVTPGASSPVYVGTGQGLFRSSDAGLNWQPKNNGIPLTSSFLPVAVTGLAVDPNAPATVWAGTDGQGLIRSTNSAENWQVVAFAVNTNPIRAIAVRPGNSNVLLVGVGKDYTTGDIYKSSNGGATWQLAWRGAGWIGSIQYDPRNPDWVYAATYDHSATFTGPYNGVLRSSGVLRSLDGGAHWFAFNASLYYPQVLDLAISDGSEPLLLAATGGAGLWGTVTPLTPLMHGIYLPVLLR